MDNGPATLLWAAVAAAALADPGVAALVQDRILEDVPEDYRGFPFVRLGELRPVRDDADRAERHVVQLGLEAHVETTRMEAAGICQALEAALHRKPDQLAVPGFSVVDIEVQTWVVQRAEDGKRWRGVLALEARVDRVD